MSVADPNSNNSDPASKILLTQIRILTDPKNLVTKLHFFFKNLPGTVKKN